MPYCTCSDTKIIDIIINHDIFHVGCCRYATYPSVAMAFFLLLNPYFCFAGHRAEESSALFLALRPFHNVYLHRSFQRMFDVSNKTFSPFITASVALNNPANPAVIAVPSAEDVAGFVALLGNSRWLVIVLFYFWHRPFFFPDFLLIFSIRLY